MDFASAVIELSEDAVSIGDRLHVVCRMESGEQVMRDLELLSEPIGVELYKAKVEKRI